MRRRVGRDRLPDERTDPCVRGTDCPAADVEPRPVYTASNNPAHDSTAVPLEVLRQYVNAAPH